MAQSPSPQSDLGFGSEGGLEWRAATGFFPEIIARSESELVNKYREKGVLSPMLIDVFMSMAPESRKCPICWGDLAALSHGMVDFPVILSCGHTFGRQCIERRIKENPHLRCPTCREPLSRMYNLITYFCNGQAILAEKFLEVEVVAPVSGQARQMFAIKEPEFLSHHPCQRVRKYREIGVLEPAHPSQCYSRSCDICGERLEDANAVGDIEYPVILPCGDAFGRNCLENEISNTPGFQCPICNVALSQMYLELVEMNKFWGESDTETSSQTLVDEMELEG